MREFFLFIFLFLSMGLSAHQQREQNFDSHSSTEVSNIHLSNHSLQDVKLSKHCAHTCLSVRAGCPCSPIYGSFYLVTSQPIRLSPGEAIPFDELTAVKTPGIRVSSCRPGEIILEEAGDYFLSYAASVIAASPFLEIPRTALALNNTTIIPGSEIRHTVESLLSPTVSKIVRISTAPVTLKFINHTPYQDIIINSIDDEIAAFLVIQKIDN